MIPHKTIRNRHFYAFPNNTPFTSSNPSSVFRRLSSFSAQSAHDEYDNAELKEKLSNPEEELRGLSDGLKNLNKVRIRKVKQFDLSSVKNGHSVAPKENGSLWALFADEKKRQSESKLKSKSISKLKSLPVERTAHGVDDPMVHKELSSDMKMFLEHLCVKGYLRDKNFTPIHKLDSTCFEFRNASEFLKLAAPNFGKDHAEIAGWLSAGDLKKIALFGCPSLGQRTVFASKHMRKFFKIDEQKVCQTCTLKKLCSYPNKGSKQNSTKLHLASVIKVLVTYAMESVSEKLVVPEEIKNCVGRLLKEIISLSQAMPRGFASHSRVEKRNG